MSQGDFHFSTKVKDDEPRVTRERVKQAYEALHARRVFQSARGYYEWLVSLLRTADSGLRISKGEAPGVPRLLDVGCGSGEMLRAARAAGMAVAGLDISETGIAQARAKVPDADLRVASTEEFPFPDAHFDYIVSVGSLEHFMDPGHGLQEMRRVARPGARVLLTLPNRQFLFAWVSLLRQAVARDQSQPLERMASREEWHELIEGNHLRILRVYKDNQFFLPGAALQALVRGIGRLIPMRTAYVLVFLAEPE